MSRFKRFAHSLASGYAALASTVLVTLASVPLALHYLSKEEFGLWALASQVAAYLSLIDAGMTGSLSRFLIDHKDHKGMACTARSSRRDAWCSPCKDPAWRSAGSC